jgi:hypothetical protein
MLSDGCCTSSVVETSNVSEALTVSVTIVLVIEAMRTSEIAVGLYETAWHNIP